MLCCWPRGPSSVCGGFIPPEKVLKSSNLHEKAHAQVQGKGIAVSAAKGELESFVLLLRPRHRRPLMDVRFEFTPPATAAAISASFERIGYVQVDSPSGHSVFPDTRDRHADSALPFGSSGTVGYFPDRLVPGTSSVATPGENTQFWVTLDVPLTAPAGTHEGQIRLRLRGTGPVDVPLTITVYDFALPKRASARNTCCWSPQYLDCRQDESFLQELYRDMVRHRQSPDPIIPQPEITVNQDGSVAIDLEAYDKMATYCMDELGATHLFFPRIGSAWYMNLYFLWHTPLVKKERWCGVQIFNDDLELTPAFQRAFGNYLKQMTDYFRNKNWLGRIYITSMDEPHTDDDFKAVRNYTAFVHSVAPEIRRFCTTYPRPGLLDSIDTWCPQQFDEATVRQRQAMGEELMFYKNWLHLIDMPMVNPRLQGWLAWRMGATGWLTYATMGKWNRAWDEPYVLYPNTGIKAWGLGLWWYPALLDKKILRSVRWEMMREGAEDYEYLVLLRDRLAALPEPALAGAPAQTAAAFLKNAASGIALYPRVLPGKLEPEWEKRPAFATSHRLVWERRNEAAHCIEALPAITPPHPMPVND